MGVCASRDVLQSKLDKLLGDIESVKTYINYILVLSKYRFENHIDHLRIIFVGLRVSVLKVNVSKCIFGLKDIPYLGYLITREGIDPDQNKV